MAEIIRINDETYRIEDGGVRFFLLTGTRKALLIDSGMTTDNAKEIAQGLTDLPLELLNTHADRDHICGNVGFKEFYMSPSEEENYREAKGKGRIIPLKEGDEIDLGERKLKIIDNPGHTPGSIAILDEKYRVLIGGDAVQDGTIYMFGKYRNIQKYVESLKHLLTYKDEFDEVYPSHASFPVSPDLIEKLIEGAISVMNNEVEGETVQMHGHDVVRYELPYAGFYCDLK